MCKKIVLAIFCLFLLKSTLRAQNQSRDSISVVPIPKYDGVSRLHRKVFGENYRREYAQSTLVPILRLSDISGGLTAVQRGGGNQSRSLRLIDSAGKEWSLRSVQKYPSILLPVPLRETFLRNIIEDNMSAQFPFGALVIPPLADAVGVPHSHPIIGWVVADKALGAFAADFEGTLCLLEEREPLGKSDNTTKMLNQLGKHNKLAVDWQTYLKAKALDVLVGDWDRHEDQWRWAIDKAVDSNLYVPVPRDRDQVFYRSDGLIQRLAQSTWLLPMMQGYEREIQNVNWFLWEGRNINSRVFSGVDLAAWNATVKEFCRQMTDSVLHRALSRLPVSTDAQRKEQFFAQMASRRDRLPMMMESYFRFMNKIVDVSLTDEGEWVEVNEKPRGNLEVHVKRLSPIDGNQTISRRTLDPAITKEIRLFLRGGNDSVLINVPTSKIKLRIVSAQDVKSLTLNPTTNRIIFYGKPDDHIIGPAYKGLRKKMSTDTANFSYIATDLYARSLTLLNVGFNNDDGLMLGISHRFTRPGFRKQPYASSHSISSLYAFNTSAFSLHYSGEWLKAIGNQDFLLDLKINAPNNTRNFFGIGNETTFDKEVNSIAFYRARFNLLTLKGALRHRWQKHSLSFGPLFQYYSYAEKENTGRFINGYLQSGNEEIGSITSSKLQMGAALQLIIDTKDNAIIPKSGLLLKSNFELLSGWQRGVGTVGLLNTEFSFYLKMNKQGTVVFSNRIGTGLSIGNPQFYQLPTLGGVSNLTGYRNHRFAGDYSVYNNSELRIKLGNFMNYIFPGELGITGTFDVGRVWKKEEHSTKLHHGIGAGIYFAPASYCLLNLVAGYSKEGWYPTFSLQSRF